MFTVFAVAVFFFDNEKSVDLLNNRTICGKKSFCLSRIYFLASIMYDPTVELILISNIHVFSSAGNVFSTRSNIFDNVNKKETADKSEMCIPKFAPVRLLSYSNVIVC